MAPLVPIGFAALVFVGLMVVQRRHKNINKALPSGIPNALAQARQLQPPVVSLTAGGEYEHGEFWGEHDIVMKSAWREWWQQEQSHLPDLTAKQDSMMDSKLLQAVQQVRQNPTPENEMKLKQLFQPVMGSQVYEIPWFTPRGVRLLRQHLDASSYYYEPHNHNHNSGNNNNTMIALEHAAKIPTRRPNGMNRYGIIIDPKIEGAVSYDGLNSYIRVLVDDFVRPMARMMFPEFTSRKHPEDDCESYAFTIRYNPDQDMELKEHSDASIYTININLNLVEDTNISNGINSDENHQSLQTNQEQYEGSSLYFVEEDEDIDNSNNSTTRHHHVKFAPGMAVIHRGMVRHAALPITTGERHNLVIWLFGQHGYVRIAEYSRMEQLTVQERWEARSSNSVGKATSANKISNPYKLDL